MIEPANGGASLAGPAVIGGAVTTLVLSAFVRPPVEHGEQADQVVTWRLGIS